MVGACLLMKRRCLAFDNNPDSYQRRVDIREGEALETIHSLKRKPDLIFLDPPYFKKLEEEYGSDSISVFPRDEYLGFFGELAGTLIVQVRQPLRFPLGSIPKPTNP